MVNFLGMCTDGKSLCQSVDECTIVFGIPQSSFPVRDSYFGIVDTLEPIDQTEDTRSQRNRHPIYFIRDLRRTTPTPLLIYSSIYISYLLSHTLFINNKITIILLTHLGFYFICLFMSLSTRYTYVYTHCFLLITTIEWPVPKNPFENAPPLPLLLLRLNSKT